jgi:hypothetical protein
LFVEAKNGKLGFIREYFDPIQAAHALDEEIKTGSRFESTATS